MKVFRKDSQCLNCNAELVAGFNYCPDCGQKNTHNNVLLGTLLRDYLGEAFSLDSRFIKSLVPFFFKPGNLTAQFNAGRRVSFINPVRLYLGMSLFYFFVLSLSLTKSVSFDDAIRVNGNKEVPAEVLQQLDSLGVVLEDQGIKEELTSKINLNGASDSSMNTVDDYLEFLKDPQVSDLQVLDSFGMDMDAANLKFASQVRKIVRKDLDVFIPFLLQNVPIMMLLLLPIFGLILKLLYIRGKVLYIRHLVHGLYLHSFAYLIYAVVLLGITYLGFSEDTNDTIGFISFLLVSIYTYLSFLKVYQQGWFKTLAKFSLTGFLYSMFLSLFAVGEFLISFFLF